MISGLMSASRTGLVFRHVDHHHALVDVPPGGGEADAGGFVHGFGHVGDRLRMASVTSRTGAARVQAGVGVAENG